MAKSYLKFKPHLLMVLVQIGYTFLYFIVEASFNHGMNPHVYITYRHIIAGLVIMPFAYFLERDLRPKLTIALFAEIFLLSVLEVGLGVNLYFASLTYTSPTFVASIVNTIACLTFLMAVLLRLEYLDLQSSRGIAKVLGTLFSLAGAMTMTLYKGPTVKNLNHPFLHLTGNATTHENWMLGSVLALISCVTWSMWYIVQGYTMKRYPAQLSLTTWINFLGAAESAVFAVIVEHRRAAWTIGFNIDLWSAIYGGVVICGLTTFIQLWCNKEKGPVFVSMFNPLSTVLVAVLAYLSVGDKLYTGSIVGGVVIILGLYLLLWGKEGDQEVELKLIEKPCIADEDQEDPKQQTCISAEKNTKQIDKEKQGNKENTRSKKRGDISL